jgi:hypothetical protein
MFFTDSISFATGIILSIIGAASLLKAHSLAQLAFACIPFVFSVQLIIEGFMWLPISHNSHTFAWDFATYTIVVFSHIIWPLLVSFTLFLLEEEENLKKILKLLAGIAVLEVFFQVDCIFTFPIHAKITGHYISYELNQPGTFNNYIRFCFVVATIAPPFFSSIKRMWVIGVLLIIALFCEDHFGSILSFFALIISVTVYGILHRMNTAGISPQEVN